MSETWFILWFLGDPVFWDWARPLGAAALGAGATAILGSQAQQRQFRMQIAAQTTQWENERTAKVIDDSMTDARKQVENFTAVHREIQQSEPGIGEIFGPGPFPEAWKQIWTKERSLQFDVDAEYIVDDRTRTEIGRMIRILDQAEDITSSGWHGRANISLRRLALHVTSAAITELGAYVRHAERPTKHDASIDRLDQIRVAYDDMIEHEIERAEQANLQEDNANADESQIPPQDQPPRGEQS